MPFPNRPRQGLRNRNNPQNRKNWQSRRKLPHRIQPPLQFEGTANDCPKRLRLAESGLPHCLLASLLPGVLSCHHHSNR
jgi:hypothetical protein